MDEQQPTQATEAKTTDTHTEYASIWLRLGAKLIDGVIVSAITAPLSIPLLIILFRKILDSPQAQNFDPEKVVYTQSESLLIGALTVASLLVVILYNVILPATKLYGTFGKRILNLRIVDIKNQRISFGTSLKRYFGADGLNIPNSLLSNSTNAGARIGATVSGALYGIYFIIDATMAMTDLKRRSLHDRIAGTFVIKHK